MGIESQSKVPRSEVTRSDQDKRTEPQVNVQEGQRLMIIKLGKYSKSWRTTYRRWDLQGFLETGKLSGHGWRVMGN